MRPKDRRLFGFLIASVLVTVTTTAQEANEDADREALRSLIGAEGPASNSLPPVPDGVTRALNSFYGQREHRLAWFDEDGTLNSALVDQLLSALCEASSEGLDPRHYPIDRIRSVLADMNGSGLSPDERAGLDLLLSQTFLLYASHLQNGRVPPRQVRVYVEREFEHLPEHLRQALERGDLRAGLNGLVPDHPQYQALLQKLNELRQTRAEGGWPTIDDGSLLKREAEDDRVAQLRKRLSAEDDQLRNAQVSDPRLFDPALEEALQRFQHRHGLMVDGVLGPKTLAELNVPAEERISQVLLSLERLRWLPAELGDRYILVNIPGYWLELRDGGERVLTSKVVVGEEGWETPVFSDHAIGAEVNPDWAVPRSIAEDKIIPILQKSPGWAVSEGMKILRNGQEVDPHSIDWHTASADEFLFVQAPGTKNPLGTAKLSMPNRFAIFLHATPADELFELRSRARSHGCIRVEKMDDILNYLFKEDGDFSELQAARASEEKTHLEFREGTPVHLTYLTAWVDEEGGLQVREDVYGRDGPLRKLLEPSTLSQTEPDTCG